MALDNMRGDLVKQTALHPIDPVKDYQGECRARTIRSDRADADGSRLDDVLTSTALQDGANYLQFPDCNGDSAHYPIVATMNTKSLMLIPCHQHCQNSLGPPHFRTPMKVE